MKDSQFPSIFVALGIILSVLFSSGCIQDETPEMTADEETDEIPEDNTNNTEKDKTNDTKENQTKELDSDGDGVVDSEDDFPQDANESVDSDGDGFGDNSDVFPDDVNEWADFDGDGIGDNSDPDDDNDLYPDELEESEGSDPLNSNSKPLDYDEDLIPDSIDTDDDGDGVADVDDIFPLNSTEWADNDFDNIGDNSDLDDDNDGYLDEDDAFPYDPTEWLDTDNDSIGDNADPDDDDDGVSDNLEFNLYGSDPNDSSDVLQYFGMVVSTEKLLPFTGGLVGDNYFLVIEDDEFVDYFQITIHEEMNTPFFSDAVIVESMNGDFHLHGYDMSDILQPSPGFDPIDYNLDRISFEGNSIGIGTTNFSAGFVYYGDENYPYLYGDYSPTFFNDVELTGTVVPISLFTDLSSLFEASPFGDNQIVEQLIGDFELGTDVEGHFIWLDEMTYQTTEIKADSFAVFNSSDFGLSSSYSGTDSVEYLEELVQNIDDMRVIILNDEASNVDELLFWIVLTDEPYSSADLRGLVGMDIAETDLSTIGLDTPDSIRFGYLPPSSEVTVEPYLLTNVTELWEIIDENDMPAVAGVSSTCITLVGSFDEIMSVLSATSGEDTSGLDELMPFAMRPGFALMIDMTFLNYFKSGTDYDLRNYTALAFLPDYQGDIALEFANVSGVVYDVGDYLDIDFHYPLLVADSYSDDGLDLTKVNLSDMPEGENTLVETHGYLSGGTIKTIKPELPIPFDVGVYVLHDKTDDTTYHVPVISLTLGQGDLCLGKKVDIKGIFVDWNHLINSTFGINLDNITDILDFGSGLADNSLFSNMFADILSSFLTYTSSEIDMLSGFILAYDITENQTASDLSIESFSVDHALEETETELVVKTEIDINSDGYNFINFVTVKFIVKTPDGEYHYQEATSLSWLNISKTFTITDFETTGMYEVYITLTEFKLSGFGKTLDSAYATFNLTGNEMGDTADSQTNAREIGDYWTEGLGEGKLSGSEDNEDWFMLTLEKGDRLTILVNFSDGEHWVDLIDDSGNFLAGITESESGDTWEIDYFIQSDGDYYIQVDKYITAGDYEISITVFSEPDVEFSDVTYEFEDWDGNGDNETLVIYYEIFSNETDEFKVTVNLVASSTQYLDMPDSVELTVEDGYAEWYFEIIAERSQIIDFTLNITYGGEYYQSERDALVLEDIEFEVSDFWIDLYFGDFWVEDEADGFNEGDPDVYFYIVIDSQYLDSEQNDTYQSDSISALSGSFNETVSFNIRDDIEYIEISIYLYDEESGSFDDIIDIDGANSGSSTDAYGLDLVLYLINGTWVGDDTTGETDGGDDDDEDEDWNGALEYDIEVVKWDWD